MKNIINDILKNLNKNLDLSYIYIIKKVKVLKKKEKSTNDILNKLADVFLLVKRNIILKKNKTINFDSVILNKKLNNINLIKKRSFFEYIYLGLKGRLTLKGNPISFFNKRVYFTKNFFKNITIVFFIFSIVLIIDGFFIENRISNGYKKIIAIKEYHGNINLVKKNINDAKFDFILSDILFKPFLLFPSENIKNGYYLLKGGKDLTKLLDEGIQIYTKTTSFINEKGGIENIELTNLFLNLKPEIRNITFLLYNTIISYNKVGDLINNRLNNKLDETRENLKVSYNLLNILNRDFNIFLSLLGHNYERKYLVLFQNNDEIRATGGFIGSLAIVTIKNGKIINFEKDDVYAYEWEINKIYKDKELAPKGLNKITKTFGLRDANYFIDFETSSKSINFFLNKINKKVDGIIYMNQNLVFDLLKLTGGIKFENIDEVIDENNFSLIISTLVEAQSFKLGTLGTPKQILFDFTNIFINKLKNDKNYFAYINIILNNIKSRDLVIYSFNSEENNLLWKLGLNGKLNYLETLDFSYPVYTSIGGNKSDRYIKYKYSKYIEKNADCSIDTSLKINRTHYFSKIEESKINKILDKYPLKDKTRKDIINIQGKGTNSSYVRLLLPKNIKIENNKGLNIKKYSNLTVVDFYINTRVLESNNFNIKYRIENKECKNYDFKFYKQPGIIDYDLEIIDGVNIIKNYGIKNDYFYKEK